MSYPTVRVEFAPTSDPLDTTPTWVDITSYVRFADGIRIKRGRGSLLEAFSAGEMYLTLNNRARRFDPKYSSGAYFGNLKPGKQIRAVATWSAVDYELFTGWVEGWPQGFSNMGKDATVAIRAFDAIGWMARNKLPTDYLFTYADAVADPGDLTMFLRRTSRFLWLDETGNGGGAQLEYGRYSSGASMMLGSGSPSLQFDTLTVWRVVDPVSSGTGQWTVAVTFQTTSDSGVLCGSTSRQAFGVGAIGGSQIGLDELGHLEWRGGTTGIDDSVVTVAKVNDGRPHLAVVTGDGSGDENDVTIYIDGVEAEVTRGGLGSGYGKMDIEFVGDSCGSPATPSSVAFAGSIQDVAFWATILPEAAVETLWAYTSAYLEEDANSRAERYLDEAGWPSAWRDIPTAKATVGQLVFGGRQVIDAMQELERTEQGRIFASKSGDITFLQRYHTTEVTRGNTVQVTFSDDGSDVGYANYGSDQAYLDIQNDITVAAAQHGEERAVDLTSVQENGPRTVTIGTILAGPDLAASMASGLVYQRKDPLDRLEPLVVRKVADALWDNVLALEFGDRIKAEITPMKTGSQVVEEMTLEGIAWNINSKLWELTVTGAPAPPDFFVVGSSLVGGSDVIGY